MDTVQATHPISEPRPGLHRIVIVGGGAGGMELATRLPRALRDTPAEVTLVDASLTHLWKPLLHEVAAGTLDMGNNEVDFLAHAAAHGFHFELGEMEGLDRQSRTVWLKALSDDETGQIAPRRGLRYDTLVLAIGGRVNDFHTPGVREHALTLNNTDDAKRLHKRFFTACLRADMSEPETVDLAIVGGGATGVELAAELRNALAAFSRCAGSGLNREAHVVLIEAGPDILMNLPEDVRAETKRALQAQRVQVRCGERVSEITAKGIKTADGAFIPSNLTVWAAGVKAPELLKDLDGLESNKLNQLVVDPSMRTTRDPRIFAMGDCAALTPEGHDRPLPPLAQVAHQQARFLARVLPFHVRGRTDLVAFRFKDHGSLIAVGPEKVVGTLVGQLTGRRFVVNGGLARFGYWALYRGYLAALHGWLRMAVATLGEWLTQGKRPRVKLH